MKVIKIDPALTHTYSRLALDYLNESPSLRPLVNEFPGELGFQNAILAREAFPFTTRNVLSEVLHEQYADLQSDISLAQVERLRNGNTFTVTTGHQLNLFTGPLYFWYKIVNVIQLANKLNSRYPDKHFVPIFWMATEDHDYGEVNHFYYQGKKIVAEQPDGNAVGRMETKASKALLTDLRNSLGNGPKAKELLDIFEKAYSRKNMSEATRFLVHHFFGDQGLLVIDADQPKMKQLFRPIVDKELKEHFVKNESQAAIDHISKTYKVQVNPRDINLFLLKEGKRERLEPVGENYKAVESNIIYSFEDLSKLGPECFSPNVLMRPIYQELILPNIAYVGGGAELAYWLELKDVFREAGVPFPVVMIRNSALWVDSRTSKLMRKTSSTWEQAFMPKDELLNEKTREWSAEKIDFSEQRIGLQRMFDNLFDVASRTDKSFEAAVRAEETRQLKGIDKLEKRLLKAEKRKLDDRLRQLHEMKVAFYPNGVWQERHMNFSELYLEFGSEFKDFLIQHLNPLKADFVIFEHD